MAAKCFPSSSPPALLLPCPSPVQLGDTSNAPAPLLSSALGAQPVTVSHMAMELLAHPQAFIPVLWLRESHRPRAFPAVQHRPFLLMHFFKRPQNIWGDRTGRHNPLCRWDKQMNRLKSHRSLQQDPAPALGEPNTEWTPDPPLKVIFSPQKALLEKRPIFITFFLLITVNQTLGRNLKR